MGGGHVLTCSMILQLRGTYAPLNTYAMSRGTFRSYSPSTRGIWRVKGNAGGKWQLSLPVFYRVRGKWYIPKSCSYFNEREKQQ